MFWEKWSLFAKKVTNVLTEMVPFCKSGHIYIVIGCVKANTAFNSSNSGFTYTCKKTIVRHNMLHTKNFMLHRSTCTCKDT